MLESAGDRYERQVLHRGDRLSVHTTYAREQTSAGCKIPPAPLIKAFIYFANQEPLIPQPLLPVGEGEPEFRSLALWERDLG
jgi:hypothetical protein